jgi:hypothetical protein
MEKTWRTIRQELRRLLGRPTARRQYQALRSELSELRPWGAPRLVASFLSRRTARIDRRKEVLRALLRVVAGRAVGAEVAGTILLLAGVLSIPALRRRGGGSTPAMPFVLIVTAKAADSVAPPPVLSVPGVAAFPVIRRLALAEVAQ